MPSNVDLHGFSDPIYALISKTMKAMLSKFVLLNLGKWQPWLIGVWPFITDWRGVCYKPPPPYCPFDCPSLLNLL